MKRVQGAMVFLGVFVIFLGFIGTVSAANLTVYPGDSIQSAVDNASDGDMIVVKGVNNGSYVYNENVVVNKRLTIKSYDGHNVTVQALNYSNPVFTINSGGNGSSISGFTITDSNEGVHLNSVSDCVISGNYLTSLGYSGISLMNSCGNIITNNYIENNQDGIDFYNSCNNNVTCNYVAGNNRGIFVPAECTYQISSFSLNNTILQNNIKNNYYGIYLWGDWSGIWVIGGMNTIDTSIISNIIYGNVYGVYSNSSQFNMHFNQLSNNSCSDLWLEVDEGVSFNAKNNWWGSNQILMDYSPDSENLPTVPMDIFCQGAFDMWYYAEASGDVDPWLVLNTNATPTNTYNNSIITADLTHNNNGDDTSPQGHVPDNIPVNFTTTLGTITPTATTRNGKANATFNCGTVTSGVATITAMLDNQSVQNNVTIQIGRAPVVLVNVNGGSYSSDKNVTLIATDDRDLHPVIFYRLNDGTWFNQTNNVTLSFYQGRWDLLYYAVDSGGNVGLVQNVTYVIDETAPMVWANLTTGLYNTSNVVNLTVTDNLDLNPAIYYTVNGSTPTTSSTRYTGPLTINSTTTLKFMAIDSVGNQANATTEYYIFAPIGNINTGRGYSSIQAAINDELTLNGHTIEVSNGTYTENVVVNKRLTIKSYDGHNVTVQALNFSNPVFTVNYGGSGSGIEGINICGATDSSGVFLSSVCNCNVYNNNIWGNKRGVDILDSSNNNITSNIIYGSNFGVYLTTKCIGYYECYGYDPEWDWYNQWEYYSMYHFSGIQSDSHGNLINGNILKNNTYGLFIKTDEYWMEGTNAITQNDITVNDYGIYVEGLYTSSCSDIAQINFNRFYNNRLCGLLVKDCSINSINNWWGTNNPLYCSGDNLTNRTDLFSLNTTSSIDPITYSPWIVDNVTASPSVSNGISVITVDLTHNSEGNDTSSQGHLPDNIPVNFTTNFGTITQLAYTRNGKASSIFSCGTSTSGTARILSVLDGQSVQINVTIDAIAPAVNTNIPGGNITALKM